MKNTLKYLAAMSVISIMMAGCSAISSVVKEPESIEQKTSFALGLSADKFTISDRQDGFSKTTYTVKTKAGKTYSCYFTKFFGDTSDALCSAMNGGDPQAKPACNELLRRAGKC